MRSERVVAPVVNTSGASLNRLEPSERDKLTQIAQFCTHLLPLRWNKSCDHDVWEGRESKLPGPRNTFSML
eukprot:6465986-Amphidinium_carterae.1